MQVFFETVGTTTPVDDFDPPTGMVTFPPGNASGSEGTLEIPAGQFSGTITYQTLADGKKEEDGETFTVEIFGVSSGGRDATASPDDYAATTNVIDQGQLTVSVRGTPSVDEGDDATFTVSIPEVTTDTVEVDWATREALGEDTAEEDVDCPAATGTVSIPAGSTSVTFTVNTTVEIDEAFQVVLTEARLAATPSEAVPLGTYQAVGTITAAAAPTGLAVTVSPGRVDEDAGATDLTVTVSLDGTTQFTVDTPVTVEMVDRPNVSKGNALPGSGLLSHQRQHGNTGRRVQRHHHHHHDPGGRQLLRGRRDSPSLRQVPGPHWHSREGGQDKGQRHRAG